jgi:hypothetical protein
MNYKLNSPLLLFLLAAFACQPVHEKVVYPYSQWTLGTSGHNITWRYMEGFEYNNSFIKAPGEGEWDTWYTTILAYRDTVRSLIGKQEPYLCSEFPARGETKIHFDKFSYQLKLQPDEEIEIEGLSRSNAAPLIMYFDFDLKSKGEEMSYVVRRKILSADSLVIQSSDNWTLFSKKISIPAFPADSFAIAPVVRLQSPEAENKVFLKDIQLRAERNQERELLRQNIDEYLANQAAKITSWPFRRIWHGTMKISLWDSFSCGTTRSGRPKKGNTWSTATARPWEKSLAVCSR